MIRNMIPGIWRTESARGIMCRGWPGTVCAAPRSPGFDIKPADDGTRERDSDGITRPRNPASPWQYDESPAPWSAVDSGDRRVSPASRGSCPG